MTGLKNICIVVLVAAAAGLPARAELAFERTTIRKSGDFDRKAIEATFAFENVGDRPIRIRKVETSCGCTAAASTAREIVPGGRGEIGATFHVGQRIGVRRNAITVHTMRGRKYPLVFETEVPRRVTIEPRMLSWRIGESTDWETARVQLHSAAELDLTGVTAGPDFEVRLESTNDPLVFKLQVRPESTGASGRTLVQIHSEPEIDHQRRLAVFAYVR